MSAVTGVEGVPIEAPATAAGDIIKGTEEVKSLVSPETTLDLSAGTKAPEVKPAETNPTEVKPSEAYNRAKHYGKTPTASDRSALGATSGEYVDHSTPLVKHFYEGDGQGGRPGYQMTQAERKAFANDRSKMTVKPAKQNRSEDNVRCPVAARSDFILSGKLINLYLI